MILSIARYLSLALLIMLAPTSVVASTLLLKGRILDGGGQPVAGAEVYVFDSANVKRPADFISEKSGGDGSYQLLLPPGRYWLLAIQRQGSAKVGPLGANDRFSGEPLVFEAGPDKQVITDFTIMSLKEAALRNHKRNEDLIKVTGRIIDATGALVSGAYAMADSAAKGEIPLYLSTWTEADGIFTLYLPKGKIFLGAARVFPPESAYFLDREIEFAADVVGLDVVVSGEPIANLPSMTDGR